MNPRPMTTYRSGIARATRELRRPCADCGKPQVRRRTFDAVDAEAQADAWLERVTASTIRCIPCWRRAGRPM